MENFPGIFFAATNIKEIIDHAALRRFSIKLKFDYLNECGNMIFFRKFFSNWSRDKIEKVIENQIRTLHFLTPVDFKVVHDNFRFIDKANIRHQTLIEALHEEIKSKNEQTVKFGFNA